MKLYYPYDIEAVAKIQDDRKEAFEKWFAELEAEYAKRGSPYGNGPLAKDTGVECWIGFFEEEFTPANALTEDLAYANE